MVRLSWGVGRGGMCPTFVTFCAPAESAEKIHRESRTPATVKKNGLDPSESGDRSQGQVRPHWGRVGS